MTSGAAPAGTPRPSLRGLFVAGTDTDVGKTVVSAWLVRALDGDYWKPVQAGLDGDTDADTVRTLSGLPAERIHESTYRLKAALSPHEAARREGIVIDLARLRPPPTTRTLIVEGAGGLLVPLNAEALMIDLIARLGLPVVLVARSTLGTINHTLLSLEALRARGLALEGVVLNGPPNEGNRRAIGHFGRVPVLAELPRFEPLDPAAIREAARRIVPGAASAAGVAT
ncbi:MAG: dethiobiotin synthase [Alphaproteobacteria bacterium]